MRTVCTSDGDALAYGIRALLTAVLMISAAVKARRLPNYASLLGGVGIESRPIIALFPYALVTCEAALGSALAAGFLGELTMLAVIALFAIFASVLYRLIKQGYEGGCNCFGSADGHITAMTIARPAVLSAAGVAAMLLVTGSACLFEPLWVTSWLNAGVAMMLLAAAASLIKVARAASAWQPRSTATEVE